MSGHILSNIPKLYIIKIAKWFMLTVPILMIFYKDQGLSVQQSFQIKAFYSIAIVLFEIPSGYLADRFGRKNSIIAGSIMGTLGFAIYSFCTGYYSFLLAEIILGLGQSCISGADSAILYDSLDQQKRTSEYTKYEGFNTSLGNFAEAVSAIIGGLLAEACIIYPFYWQTGIAFLAVPAAFMLVTPLSEKKQRSLSTTNVLKIMAKAWLESPDLRWNVLYSSVMGAATLTMAWIYQLLLKDFGYSNSHIGTIASVLNLTAAISTAFSFKIERKLGARSTVIWVTLLIAGGFFAPGFISGAAVLIVLWVFYFARGIATPVFKDYINQSTPSEIRATILSVRAFLIRIAFAILGPLIGWFADKFTMTQTFQLTGILFVVLFAVCMTGYLPYVKRTDRKS
jgi:MFS family permease